VAYSKAEEPEDLYTNYLKNIDGINFTRRQIDVIACIISGWNSKGIALRLNILRNL